MKRMMKSRFKIQVIYQVSSKVEYVFRSSSMRSTMVVVSMLPHAEYGPNDHREDVPYFINGSILQFLLKWNQRGSIKDRHRFYFKSISQINPFQTRMDSFPSWQTQNSDDIGYKLSAFSNCHIFVPAHFSAQLHF